MQDILGFLKPVGDLILYVAALIGAIFTFIKVKSFIFRPHLEVLIINTPPHCHKTKVKARAITGDLKSVIVAESDCYYFRLLIKNKSKKPAVKVEIFAKELYEENADGTFIKLDWFLPMHFLWSHTRERSYPTIHKDTPIHCDLAHIIKPQDRHKFDSLEDNPQLNVPPNKTLLAFDLEVRSFTQSYLIPPGKFKLKVQASSSNTKPVEKIIEINHTGNWYDIQNDMLNKGIGLREVQKI